MNSGKPISWSNVTSAFGLILISLAQSARSFTPRANVATGMVVPETEKSSRRARGLVLHYHYSPGDRGGVGGDEGSSGDGFSSNRASAKVRHGYAIPILGPIPNAKPLFPGGDMALDPPTPLQWKALEESVVVHRNFLKGREAGDGDDSATAGIIDAAPLVAVIDDVTGATPTGAPGSNAGERGRYATIAAVVGISSKARSKGGARNDDEERFSDSFMHFGVADDMISPLSSNVRLVGVGRAVLRDFFYKTPTMLQDESKLLDAKGKSVDYNERDEDEDLDEWDDGYADSTPIVMAEFFTMRDLNTLNYGDDDMLGTKGARSARSSPVHAMAELNRLSNQVRWMHDERRRLAAGMSAAKARLQLREKRMQWEGENAWSQEEIDDYDGIGLTNSGFSTSVAQGEEDADDVMTVEELLIRYQKKTSQEANEDKSEKSELAPSPDIEASSSRIAQMENYGLNYYSYFSSIPDLTEVALRTFEPYYSKEYRENEEHALQVFSFVAFRALEGYADPIDMAWALHCQSTVERLQRAYDIMLMHRRELEHFAENISQELADCGEECTDLW